jgi:hypothetical protein
MSTRRNALTALIAAISVGVSLGVALGTGPAAAGVTSRTMTGWGIETITATSTDRTPKSVTVHASGVYTGTGTFRLPVTGKATTLRFVFGDGTLTANASSSYSVYGHYNCPQNVTSDRTFTISPTQSTGVFANATGTSDYTAFTTQYSPRLSNGACDLSSRVKPLGGTVYVSITIEGPLTLQGH